MNETGMMLLNEKSEQFMYKEFQFTKVGEFDEVLNFTHIGKVPAFMSNHEGAKLPNVNPNNTPNDENDSNPSHSSPTGGLSILKVDQSYNTIVLSGAEFAIYKTKADAAADSNALASGMVSS